MKDRFRRQTPLARLLDQLRLVQLMLLLLLFHLDPLIVDVHGSCGHI